MIINIIIIVTPSVWMTMKKTDERAGDERRSSRRSRRR